jgi:hypothetical protein
MLVVQGRVSLDLRRIRPTPFRTQAPKCEHVTM